MRRSTLGRLFTYSKATAATAQENFTTEALAAAVRQDPAPMAAALRELARRSPDFAQACPETVRMDGRTVIGVDTQVFLSDVDWGSGPDGFGFLDLVLHLASGRSVWIEVKVGAPLGPGQLVRYQDAARRRRPAAAVILLRRGGLDDSSDVGVPVLDWSDLYASVRRHGSLNAWWSDLLDFLEEEDVASDRTMEITDREGGSLQDAFHLFQKVEYVLSRVHHHLWVTYPEYRSRLTWANERRDKDGQARKVEQTGSMLNFASTLFRTRGSIIATGGHFRYGLVDRDGSANWYMAVERDGWKSDKVDTLIALMADNLAQEGGSGRQWSVDPGGSIILERLIRVPHVLGAGSASDAAVEWFIDGFDQVASTGVLEFMWPGRAGGTEAASIDTEPIELVSLAGEEAAEPQ